MLPIFLRITTANARTCTVTAGVWWPILSKRISQSEGTMKDMVLDFGEFKQAVRAMTEALDHTFIVEEGSLSPQTIACLEDEGFTLSVMPFRTTAENLARFFFDHLREQGLPIAQIDVYETPNNCAIYRG